MSFINFQSFDPLFLQNKGKTETCGVSKYLHHPNTLLRKTKQISEILLSNFVKSGWSDLKDER